LINNILLTVLSWHLLIFINQFSFILQLLKILLQCVLFIH